MDLAKKYYPDGCPICGHDVTFEPEYLKYICYGCNAHADCHKYDSGNVKKYQPTEAMASNETHILRRELRDNFSKLFRERRYIQGEHSMIQTSLINIVYPVHLVRSVEDGREKFYKVINKNGDFMTVMSMDEGIMTLMMSELIGPASNRDKAMVFLGEKLGMPDAKVNIGFLDESQLKQANSIVHRSILEARGNSLEDY